MEQPFEISMTARMNGNPATVAFEMVVGFSSQSRKGDSPPVASSSEPEIVFKYTTFPSELAISKGLGAWPGVS